MHEDVNMVSRGWLGRRELVLWVVAAILANQALHVVDLSAPSAFVASVISLNLVYWLAGAVIVSRVLGSDRSAAASRLEVMLGLGAVAAMGITGLVGYRMGVGIVSTAVAAYILARDHHDISLRAAGAVLLALSAYLVWGPIFFQLVTPELLAADAFVVRSMMALWEPSMTAKGLTFTSVEGHAITLIGACSSFANMSIALLSGVAITMAMRPRFVARDVLAIAAVCALMVLLNAARICLAASSEARHLYWHDGVGAQILALVHTVLIFAMAYQGARWAGRSAAP